MIYPKDIVDYIQNDRTLRERFPYVVPTDHLHTTDDENCGGFDYSFEQWMYEEGWQKSLEIKRYLFFLATMSHVFRNIYRFFDKINIDSQTDKDQSAIATSPEEMLYIARYLYYLTSYDTGGDVLECGCFKGFSSCCLSWACHFLGKRLIIADSFQGLPEVGHEYYQKADFKGAFETVKSNIATLGRIDAVEFIQGWYHESLVGLDRPLCLLWMDVDLYQSVLDVLRNTFSRLTDRGVIFSHEFTGKAIRNERIKEGDTVGEVPKAAREFFYDRHIQYRAKFLTGNLGFIVPFVQERKLSLSPQKQMFLCYYPHIQTSLQSTLSSRKQLVSTTRFWVDTINMIPTRQDILMTIQSADEIIISGWAVDDSMQNLADGVLIDIDGKLFSVFYGFPREDVAAALGSVIYTNSGFQAIIPVDDIGIGRHTLSLNILSKDTVLYFIPDYRITFEIIG